MPEFRVVPQAERSPSMCVACGGNNAPFIDLDVSTFPIATPSGWTPIVDGSLYLCIGTADNPGCAVQLGRKTGLLIDLRDAEDALIALAQAKQEVLELKAIGRKKQISLEDAERILAPAGDF